jgi:hypothetical protein
MRGRGERRIDLIGCGSAPPIKTDIARTALPDQGSALGKCAVDLRDCRLLFVVDDHLFGTVLRGQCVRSNHYCDGFADKADLVPDEKRARCLLCKAPVTLRKAKRLGAIQPAVRSEIFSGQDRNNAWKRSRRRHINGPDACRSKGRTDKRAMKRICDPQVIGIEPAPGNEAGIFTACER